jgi:sRNA-binding protein
VTGKPLLQSLKSITHAFVSVCAKSQIENHFGLHGQVCKKFFKKNQTNKNQKLTRKKIRTNRNQKLTKKKNQNKQKPKTNKQKTPQNKKQHEKFQKSSVYQRNCRFS